jgi:hypothetical protein
VKHVVPSHRGVAKSRGDGVSEERDLPAAVGAHYDADTGYDHEITRLETAAPVQRAMTERSLARLVASGSIVADEHFLYAGRQR